MINAHSHSKACMMRLTATIGSWSLDIESQDLKSLNEPLVFTYRIECKTFVILKHDCASLFSSVDTYHILHFKSVETDFNFSADIDPFPT